ncbi:glycosyltransferase family 2 protein [Xylanibacter brevis]|uniref:glycosyltransferase family 2 protein n=1 Tax=Xylanibacter brevis TaxID=83231 RepID=UPI000694DC40|nr:glycosyltransferase [Xylanibacter brevis]
MNNPLLSIITPVYNVEDYLDRCVQSVLSQSYLDIELILIDDGSTDGSSTLCDKWATTDSRITVIHKKNGGVSTARNAGLEVVKGDYLTFVDPDDFLAPDTYAPNMEYILEHPDVDILQYPYCNYISDAEAHDYHKPSVALLTGAEQIFKNWWSGTPLEYVIWNKIYKRSLWADVHFNVGHISEDTCLVPIFSLRAKAIYISERGLYYYQRNRKDSYTYNDSFDKHLDLFYAHIAIYDCFKHFPQMVTEKVLAFTRLYRRLIIAKQALPSSYIHAQLNLIEEYYPTWKEILSSQDTEKIWLSVAKILGSNIFVKLFVRYLNSFQ